MTALALRPWFGKLVHVTSHVGNDRVEGACGTARQKLSKRKPAELFSLSRNVSGRRQGHFRLIDILRFAQDVVTWKYMKKKMLAYTLEITRDEDGYLVQFPALPGCTTWGQTYEDAVQHAEEALVGFLQALQLNGEDIPVEQSTAPVSLGLMVDFPLAV